MKKILIVATVIIIIIFVGITILFLANNNNDAGTNSNNSDSIENKINLGEISEIVCKNIYNNDGKQQEDLYNIINKENIKKVKELIENQEIIESNNGKNSENYIEVMLNDNEEKLQIIVYESNNVRINEKSYNINTNMYSDLLNILQQVYYLHDSDLELPSEEKCVKKKKKALSGLSQNKKKEINTKLRNAHTTMEFLLMDGTKNLKQSNSIYWNLYNEAEIITEQTGEGLEFSKDSCFRAVANNITDIANIIKNEETKEIFNSIYEKLNKAMENKDIAELFELHKQIHDLDYWVINYPVYFDSAPAPDWEGIETYFGASI